MVCFLRTEIHNDILVIQLDGPDDIPRLTRRVLRELQLQFERVKQTVDVRAVVITGSEKSFAAGADLEEVSELTPMEALRFSALGQAVMREIDRCPKPVIAAIRGFCLGGGFDLAMACHVRIAGEDAQFGHPGGALGIMTGWGGTARLPRIVGQARAAELLASGRMIGAAEAQTWRFVSRVVPAESVVDAAMELARRIVRPI